MPIFANLELPSIAVLYLTDNFVDLLKAYEPSPEEIMELIFYLNREKEKADALDEAITELKGMMAENYKKRRKDRRGRTESTAGMVTYTPEGTKRVLKDRDATVAALTPEQLRASYKPDMKVLETILKKDILTRLTKKERVSPKLSYRDLRGDFEYLDF